MRHRNLLAAQLAVVLTLFSPVATAFPQKDAESAPSIIWSTCPEGYPLNVDCAQLVAPLDYCKPQGDKISLGMLRLKSNGTREARIGSLIFNPGGPGGVASDAVAKAAAGVHVFDAALLEHYDLIGLDPRGIGMSTPGIRCDPNIWNERVSFFPKTQAAFDQLVAHNKALGASCANLTGPLINHLDVSTVAKDMEYVRIALNDGKLNYLGASYGSEIGAAYTELYPRNINRMCLDAIVDHSQSEISTMNSLASAFELTINHFFEWCQIDETCVLHGQDIAAIFDSVVANASNQPIPAPGCLQTGSTACRSDVSGEEILFGVQNLLAAAATWPAASLAIAQAAQGNATLLSLPWPTENKFVLYGSMSVSCQDWIQTTSSLEDKLIQIQMTTLMAPHTLGINEASTFGARCIGWPAAVASPQHKLHHRVSKAPPIWLVNSWYDPTTPLAWAAELWAQLPSSVLVTRQGVGHGSYFNHGDISKVVDAYFVDGSLPKQGSVYSS